MSVRMRSVRRAGIVMTPAAVLSSTRCPSTIPSTWAVSGWICAWGSSSRSVRLGMLWVQLLKLRSRRNPEINSRGKSSLSVTGDGRAAGSAETKSSGARWIRRSSVRIACSEQRQVRAFGSPSGALVDSERDGLMKSVVDRKLPVDSVESCGPECSGDIFATPSAIGSSAK